VTDVAARERPASQHYSLSLARGLAILQLFSSDRQLLGIADIAGSLGGSRPTTHRYAITLVALGFLEQPPNSARKYRLGPRAHDFGRAVLNSRYLRPTARPYLEELRSTVSYTVSLGLLDGSDLIIMDRLHGYRGHPRLKPKIGIGSRLPSYCTSMGKVLLAYLPADERRETVEGMILEKHGPNTIGGKRALQRELEQVSAIGFAVDDEELADGVRSIAAPTRSKTGRVVGAVSVEAPAAMVDRLKMIKDFGPPLIKAAQWIAADLEDETPFKVRKPRDPQLEK
jgi:IclR family transcriptional regulator, pca regulon regulatory protein